MGTTDGHTGTHACSAFPGETGGNGSSCFLLQCRMCYLLTCRGFTLTSLILNIYPFETFSVSIQ